MVVYLLWLITSSYSSMLGTYPTPNACTEIGGQIDEALKDAMPAGRLIVCVKSLAPVGGVAQSGSPLPAVPPVPAKPPQTSLPDAPALLRNGLRLISQ